MSNRYILLLLSFFIFLYSCENKDNNPESDPKPYSITGSVQKGPFVNGSDITVYELDTQFKPTGRTFHSTLNELGGFKLQETMLISPFVELNAEGFYFNEISGDLSSAKISLKAIVDLSVKDSCNINLLTDLEFERVKYLIANQNLSLIDAKTQAQEELLTIFSLESFTVGNAESLDITQIEEDDAILLAISAIMHGNLNTSELSELKAYIADDISEDGILNNTVLQNKLLGQAMVLNCSQIKQNLLNRYIELELEIDNINHFEDYVDYFIDHFSYNFDWLNDMPFSFPYSTDNGINILHPDILEINDFGATSFAVDMPNAGNIKIVMTRTAGLGMWGYSPSEAYGWKVSVYNEITNSQTFTSTLNGVIIDMPIYFFISSGQATLEYFYNNSNTSFFTKLISWGGEINDDFVFVEGGKQNLLNVADGEELFADTLYAVRLQKAGAWDINFSLTYPEGMNVEVYEGMGDYSYTESVGLLNFTLSGSNERDYISEIVLNILGEGTINLSSEDLEIEEGVPLNRNYVMTRWE